jgi:predicted flap endonuclease-1-like 5' DNA nuclease
MDNEPSQTNRSIIYGIVGLVIGLVIGLVVLGWWLFPVEWVDFSPEQMGPADQEEYLRMAIDSLNLQFDSAAAISRYQDLGEDGPAILATIQANPAPQSENAVTAFTNLVQAQPETAAQAGGSVLRSILIVLLILLLLALLAYLAYRLIRRQPTAAEVKTLPTEFPPEASQPEEVMDMATGISVAEAGAEDFGTPETEIEVTEFEDQGEAIPEIERDASGSLAAGAGVMAAAAVVGALSAEKSEETPLEAGEEAVELVPGAEETLDEEGGPGALAAGAAVLAATEMTTDSEAAESGAAMPVEAELEEPDTTGVAAKIPTELEYIEGIGPAYAQKLKEVGVNTPQQLLQWGATPRGRQAIAERSEISGKLILKWVNHIDLFRVKGIGSEYAELLEQSGVDTVVELATRNPANLYQTLVSVNEAKKLVRKLPVLSQVEDWVNQAKNLPRVVSY